MQRTKRQRSETSGPQHVAARPSKRRRLHKTDDDDDGGGDDDSVLVSACGRHPLGVEPRGNLLLVPDGAEGDRARVEGLGLFGLLDESLLIDFLKTYLVPASLGALAQTSRCMRCYLACEEIWKKLTIDMFGSAFSPFEGSWRATCANRLRGVRGVAHTLAPGPQGETIIYSDYLFQEWHCAVVPLEPWAGRENVRRISARDLSVEEFRQTFDYLNEPVVITDALTHWPAFANGRWTREALVARFPDVRFAAGLVDMTLAEYFLYCDRVQEEIPLYLFDKRFGEKAPGLLADYTPPPYFSEDFFRLLEPSDQPEYRWWLVGPPRSGSTFHKDPNYTSAWNALISGRKKWILTPPDLVPPRVFPSADGWDVTAPISLVLWYLDAYAELRQAPFASRVVEVDQRPGDLLFIPAQWWHSALNIEASIAVTQNVVSRGNLPEVLRFLRRKGLDEDERVYCQLRDAIERHHPTVLAEIAAWRKARGFDAAGRFPMPKSHAPEHAPVSLWQSVLGGAEPVHTHTALGTGGAFAFSFGGGGGGGSSGSVV